MRFKSTVHYDEKEREYKPSPTQYTPNTHILLTRQPVTKIGTTKRQDLSVKKQLEYTMSPQAYKPVYSVIQEHRASFKFGSMERPDITKEMS